MAILLIFKGTESSSLDRDTHPCHLRTAKPYISKGPFFKALTFWSKTVLKSAASQKFADHICGAQVSD